MITDLIVKSNGNINIDRTKITSDFDMIVEIKGSTLEIKNKNDYSCINNTFMSNISNSCIGNTYISRDSYNIVGNNIYCNKLKGRIVIENVDVTDIVKEYIDKQKEDQKTECLEYVYTDEISLKSITLSGSGKINVISSLILKQNLSISLVGFGNIILSQAELNTVNISLTGSGNIDGNGLRVANLVCNLNGAGDIGNFKVMDTCNCTVVGSGDIKIKTSNYCVINKNKIGSGSIKIIKD